MPVQYGGDKITFGDGSTVGSGWAGFKNRIINGAMTITQRNGTSSVTPTDGQYTIDRYISYMTQSSKFTVQQDAGGVTPPAGFNDYLGVTSTSAYSVGAGDFFGIAQYIEGFNTADLGFGTANASTVTLSFWVRSSLTGTFASSIANSAFNRSYPYTYTINQANTWEYKTITIAGDTTGTWIGATNGIGLRVYFNLGAGSTYAGTAGAWAGSGLLTTTGATSVVGTNGATFYITGVQLEKGSTATSFDYRPYGTELNLCQRYYNKVTCGGYGFNGFVDTSTSAIISYVYPVTMRTAPTLQTSGIASDYQIRIGGVGSVVCSAVPVISSGNEQLIRLNATTSSGLTAGQGALLNAAGSTMYLGFVAEL